MNFIQHLFDLVAPSVKKRAQALATIHTFFAANPKLVIDLGNGNALSPDHFPVNIETHEPLNMLEHYNGNGIVIGAQAGDLTADTVAVFSYDAERLYVHEYYIQYGHLRTDELLAVVKCLDQYKANAGARLLG